MAKDADAIRMRYQDLVDRQHKLKEEARAQCANAFMDVNQRMTATLDAYALALESQLKSLEASTITEETLLDEMMHASQFQRDRIRAATAIPPLIMDADRLQLQERCAAAEEKAEELPKQIQCFPDAESLKRRIEELQKGLEDLQQKDIQKRRILDSRLETIGKLKKEKLTLQLERDSAKRSMDQINERNSTLTQQNVLDESVMLGLKARMETAENELERLKRKRTDSISPERVITGILKRSADLSPSKQSAAGKDVISSSAQPTPKIRGPGRKGGMPPTRRDHLPLLLTRTVLKKRKILLHWQRKGILFQGILQAALGGRTTSSTKSRNPPKLSLFLAQIPLMFSIGQMLMIRS
jgi:hypothetical protein